MEDTRIDRDTEQQIRERAYFLWQKEGSPEGQDRTMWERAALLHAAEGEPDIMTPLQARSPDEIKTDEAVEASFPASDPPNFTPESGIRSTTGDQVQKA